MLVEAKSFRADIDLPEEDFLSEFFFPREAMPRFEAESSWRPPPYASRSLIMDVIRSSGPIILSLVLVTVVLEPIYWRSTRSMSGMIFIPTRVIDIRC